MTGFGMTGAMAHTISAYDRASLEEAATLAAQRGVSARTELLSGNVVDEIVAYADAIESNIHAVHADETYIAGEKPSGLYPVGYYPHNYHFLAMAATLGVSERAVEKHVTVDAHGIRMEMLERQCPHGWSTAGHPPAPCRLLRRDSCCRLRRRPGDAPRADLRDVQLADRGSPRRSRMTARSRLLQSELGEKRKRVYTPLTPVQEPRATRSSLRPRRVCALRAGRAWPPHARPRRNLECRGHPGAPKR